MLLNLPIPHAYKLQQCWLPKQSSWNCYGWFSFCPCFFFFFFSFGLWSGLLWGISSHYSSLPTKSSGKLSVVVDCPGTISFPGRGFLGRGQVVTMSTDLLLICSTCHTVMAYLLEVPPFNRRSPLL